MSQIVSLQTARVRSAEHLQPGSGTEHWMRRELERSDPEQWVFDAIAGLPHEDFALACWSQQPNLRKAAVKLASYITPRWPTEDGSSLLAHSIGEAVKRAKAAVDNGEVFTGRFVGVYLYGLTLHARDVARLSIKGVDRFGVLEHWRPFSEPLQPWASRLGVDTLIAETVAPGPTEATVEGIRSHMIVRVSDPIDTGYLLKHAAQG
ncbi:hypothetical protein [Hydrogenophaga sp. PBL-H3]|jgi:hypothetical protein|uniref:hypothetical protein n=1 Tax=Hydrogenophaga sp. PBL-H3 TaxID=434010 RepID=UPI00131F69C1|nr:hypothetical protein [Hydrogenophaga sp. PBL-H3]QHE78562.1 hypothetical protein F9Z45_20650 [Hydrogenophaga sp. PBL-H3]QHE82987.1 hypothetical protein F9Z44_20650 [Hydrogenophaga sp. PBL-H3]